MSNQNTPLLSIVIATKNREYYCIESIKSILAIDSDEIQLAIADNSDSELIKEFVATLSDNNRLVYKYDNSQTSSIENFNRCMALATGEYVCMIGDDDSVLPVILDIVRWAKLNNVNSICSNNLIDYYWPKARLGFDNGLLIFPTIEFKKTFVNSKKILRNLLRDGIANHYTYSLPKVYHGLVKRDLFVTIKLRTGDYFGGLSPDIYSSIALSCLISEHCEISLPFTIAGACAKSSTAENLVGKHSGELKDVPHLKNRHGYVWDENIPKYYSVYTIWCESALQALCDMNENKLYRKYNKFPLFAIGILANRKYIFKLTIDKTEEIRKKDGINFIFFWSRIILNMGIQISKRVYRELRNKFFLKKVMVSNVTTIQNAIEIVSSSDYYNKFT
jgi:glycosyltransferase involved in cell wall biosynthesis